MFLNQLNPIALQLGPLSVRWYGIMYMLGFIAAYLLGRSRIRAGRLPGVTERKYDDLILAAIVGVMVGGRLGYILFYDLSTYIAEPSRIIRIWEGGMSFHGGFIGVMVAMAIWSRRQSLHFFDTMDFVAPLVPPGLFFGRIGNFINGELWGKYTESGWGVVFPNAERSLIGLDPAAVRAQYETGALDELARHPSQLYQAGLEGVALFVLLWWFSRRPRHRYAVSGLFALGYGIFRFIVEFIRVPDERLSYLAFGWLTMGQLLSMPLIIVGLILLFMSRRAPVLEPEKPAEPEEPEAGDDT